MADKLSNIQLLFQKRNARSRGSLSSEQYNDNMEELSADLTEITDQWNNRLLVLTDALPNQTGSDLLDAFETGLDGQTIYLNQDATSSSYSTYYNSTQSRPNTIYEQIGDIYTTIDALEADLEGQITAFSQNAAQVPITDNASLYAASNVESALEEVMTAVNAITVGALDLSNVAQHYIPSADDTWDIGTAARRVRDIYLGPTTMNIVSAVGDGANAVAKTFQFKIEVDDAGTAGQLKLIDGGTTVASFASTGVSFPASITSALNDLSDVDTTGVADGNFLRYNSGASEWRDNTAALDDLSDVSIAAVASGQFIKYDGSSWQNATLGSAAIGQVTYWTGADTINGNADFFWDISNSRLGVLTTSPNESITTTGVLSLGISMVPSTDAGYGKIWYDADGSIHILDGAGTEGIIPVVDPTYITTSGDIPYFDANNLLGTASGLHWDIGSQTLGIGTETPNMVAGLDVTNGAGPILFPRLPQAEINALSAVNGMTLYNTTTNKFQGYANGSWVDLH